MAFDESVSGYLSLDCTLRVPDIIGCMIGYCTHLGHWYADYDDRLPWFGLPMLRFFLCITAISIRDTDMLVALIDYLALFSIVTLILSCLFWPLHMHTLAIVYRSAWHVDYLTCILFWSSFEHNVCIVIRPDSHSFLRGHEWYIMYSDWLYVAWLPFFYMIACCLSMWAAYLSPYLQLSWFQSFFSSWFSLLQVWDLLCACSLTELEIRSKV